MASGADHVVVHLSGEIATWGISATSGVWVLIHTQPKSGFLDMRIARAWPNTSFWMISSSCLKPETTVEA
ncbi:hypothetical protein ADL12_09655 [Streptomyces regalis]|uniref:Uncharacterized protein n=1 Tax=Streptomyces regalis TaxID=68262 RepID=A0A0X3VD33_9ACTN|nr:hypothetical protein ADL12_09655 [Streptomyces regalis]